MLKIQCKFCQVNCVKLTSMMPDIWYIICLFDTKEIYYKQLGKCNLIVSSPFELVLGDFK